MIETLDRLRHLIPFWWWLTYDALVLAVIVIGVPLWSFAFWLGIGTLSIAVAIDTVEFIVKRPSARQLLAAKAAISRSDDEFTVRAAFADALLAFRDIGRDDVADTLEERWSDVDVRTFVGR